MSRFAVFRDTDVGRHFVTGKIEVLPTFGMLLPVISAKRERAFVTGNRAIADAVATFFNDTAAASGRGWHDWCVIDCPQQPDAREPLPRVAGRPDALSPLGVRPVELSEVMDAARRHASRITPADMGRAISEAQK